MFFGASWRDFSVIGVRIQYTHLDSRNIFAFNIIIMKQFIIFCKHSPSRAVYLYIMHNILYMVFIVRCAWKPHLPLDALQYTYGLSGTSVRGNVDVSDEHTRRLIYTCIYRPIEPDGAR